MDVGAVGAEHGLVVERAPDHGEQGVGDGQAQRNDGDQNGDGGGRFLVGLDRADGKDVAEEHGAGVAHKNGGGIEVVDEEADGRPAERGHEQHHDGIGAGGGEDEGGHQAEQAHAGGQAVESVDEVHGVDDAHDPQHGEDEAERAEAEHADEGKREDVDAEAGPIKCAGDGELGEEFLAGARAANVVVQAEPADGDAADEEGEGAVRVGVEDSAHAAGFEKQGQERCVEAGGDGDAAQARDGAAVNLAGRYVVVEQVVLERESPHEWRQQTRHQAG